MAEDGNADVLLVHAPPAELELIEKGEITGTVKFFGTPAEEKFFGKLWMIRDGVFDDVVNVSLYRNDTLVTSKNVTIDKDNTTYSVDLVWENATVGNYDFKVKKC